MLGPQNARGHVTGSQNARGGVSGPQGKGHRENRKLESTVDISLKIVISSETETNIPYQRKTMIKKTGSEIPRIFPIAIYDSILLYYGSPSPMC